MFAKLLLLLGLISQPAWGIKDSYDVFSTDITVENHVLISVNDKTAVSIRIYAEEEVTSIAAGAFDGCYFSDLMVSTTVKEINAEFPETFYSLHYTGALEDIEFEYALGHPVMEYGYDEGFLNYWQTYIRPNTDGASICNVSKEHYTKMKSLYSVLGEGDKERVNSKKDGTGTILDSIKYLDSYFAGGSSSRNTEREIPQSIMITLILIIASFGMTSIGIFYIFKDKNLIK